MKPIQLKIKGLNSFVEEQVIDFSRLTETGVFGIFGPTGSGKSTILDAIILALYGRIPRAGGQPAGIINMLSNQVSVYFEFAIGAGQDRKQYGVQRILKRTRNDGASTVEAKVCDITNPDDIQVIRQGQRDVNNGIEEIIGLTAEDFTRSVVLPQGSFSEFLHLTGRERSSMLERIFSLEKYGEEMTAKIARFKSRKKEEQNLLQGELNTFIGISSEELEQRETQIHQALEQKEQLEQTKKVIEQDYQKYLNIWRWQEELQGYREEEKELLNQSDDYAARQKKLVMAEKAALLKPLIDRITEQDQTLNRQKIKLDAMEISYAALIENMETMSLIWVKIDERKNGELPRLLEKKNDLETAVRISQEIEKIEGERVSLQKEYKHLVSELNSIKIDFNNVQHNIREQNGSLAAVNAKIDNLKISYEEREQLDKAYETEKEYWSLEKEIDKLTSKIRSAQEGITNIRKKLSELADQHDEKTQHVQILQQQQEQLKNNCPGNNAHLLALQQKIIELQNEIREVEQLEEQRQQALQELDEQETNIIKLEQQLETNKAGYLSLNEQHLKLKENIEKSRETNMAVFLASRLEEGQPCLVCGAVHHPALADAELAQELNQQERELEKLEKAKRNQQQSITQLDIQWHSLKGEINNIKANLAIITKKIGGRTVAHLDGNRLKIENQHLNLQQAIQQWETEVNTNSENLEKGKDILADLKQAEALHNAAHKRDVDLLMQLQDEFEKVNKLLDENRVKYHSYLKIMELDSIEERYREVKEKDRQLSSLEIEEKSLRATIDKLNNTQSELQAQIQDLEIKRAESEKSSSEKGDFINKQQAEMLKLCGGVEPVPALNDVIKEINKIDDEYKSTKTQYEADKNNLEELKSGISRITGEIESLQKTHKIDNDQMENQLCASGFTSSTEALAGVISLKEIEVLRNSITEYTDLVKINQQNINRLIVKLKGEQIEEQDWKILQQKRINLNDSVEELNRQILLMETKKQELKNKLEKLQQLQEKKSKIDHQYSLLEELENLFRGKKFVEFIARTRLDYIAKEASRQLKEITRGRYALELNSEGEFVIRDDFNGGIRRPPHTLSGGEIFLTSLSLALALSSNIQLGKSSLEFFFLDEGFGTLDAESLDLVMGSLERLHSSQMSIGVISHVEEIKQRMPRRLIVKPAVPGLCGSRIEIEIN